MDPIWEKLHSSRSWGKYPAESLIRKVKRHFGEISKNDEMSILEIGCGAGANLTFFLEEGFNVTGIDGSPSAIKNANKFLSKKYKNKLNKLKLEITRFEDLSYKEESFDLVVDYFASYTNKLKDIELIYSNIKKILKKNGRFYSKVWGDLSEGSKSGQIIEPGTTLNPESGPCRNMGTSHFFNQNELKNIFSGWSEVEITQIISSRINNNNRNLIEEFEIWAKP